MPRTRNLLIGLATAGILAGVSMIGFGVRRDGTADVIPQAGAAKAPVAAAVAPPNAAGPDPAELARQERRKRVAALDAALEKYAATVPEFSVAVLDRRTGEKYAYRGKERYETASIVKVQVLACLLLKAQAADRDLTSNELALAKRMIRASDNDATTELFGRLGRVSGLSRSNKSLGLTSTKVNAAWGFTKTTVDDQLKLLSELVDTKGPLDADSRALALDLMTTVQADQNWGVSAAAADGETTAIKNGWDTRSTEGGRWIVNSVGRITGGDDVDVSLAVLSHGNSSREAGIGHVEKVAELTRKHLRY